MNATDLNEMNKIQEILEKRTIQMERELCEAMADVFKKYGQPFSIEDVHDIALSLLILHSYGYKTPQKIHELMYMVGKPVEIL